jgi:hypothetical protein
LLHERTEHLQGAAAGYTTHILFRKKKKNGGGGKPECADARPCENQRCRTAWFEENRTGRRTQRDCRVVNERGFGL